MCFRYSLGKTLEQIQQTYAVEPPSPGLFDEIAGLLPRFDVNAFVHPRMPVITNDQPHLLQFFEWGLIPPWTKSETDAAKLQKITLNARVETCFEKPAFRSSVKRKRCLVPADGFYEWMDVNKTKYPHFIYFREHRIFSFAGIWEEWTDKSSGQSRQSFSIITTRANPLMEKIHNLKKRMPLILSPDMEGLWLHEETGAEDIKQIINDIPHDEMMAHPISRRITARDQDTNSPDIQKVFEYPELALIN